MTIEHYIYAISAPYMKSLNPCYNGMTIERRLPRDELLHYVLILVIME